MTRHCVRTERSLDRPGASRLTSGAGDAVRRTSHGRPPYAPSIGRGLRAAGRRLLRPRGRAPACLGAVVGVVGHLQRWRRASSSGASNSVSIHALYIFSRACDQLARAVQIPSFGGIGARARRSCTWNAERVDPFSAQARCTYAAVCGPALGVSISTSQNRVVLPDEPRTARAPGPSTRRGARRSGACRSRRGPARAPLSKESLGT